MLESVREEDIISSLEISYYILDKFKDEELQKIIINII